MNKLWQFFLDMLKNYETGDLPTYVDPAAPPDLGSALTQDEIDFVKSLKKEMDERFSPP